jgi:hypothetical protein
LINPGKLDL